MEPLHWTEIHPTHSSDKDSIADCESTFQGLGTNLGFCSALFTFLRRGPECKMLSTSNSCFYQRFEITCNEQFCAGREGYCLLPRAPREGLEMEEAKANCERSACLALGPGWIREVVFRSTCSASGQKYDVYYRGPIGKRVRSKPELVRLVGDSVDLTMFEYCTGTINPNLAQNKKPKNVIGRWASGKSSLVDSSVSADENSMEAPRRLAGSTPLPVKLPRESPFTPAAPVKLPKDWRAKSGHTPLPVPAPVKLAKDWKVKPGKTPPLKISKDASSVSAPAVNLAKDWKERSGQSSQSQCGKLPPMKLSKDVSNSPVKLSKDWKEKSMYGKFPPVKVSKDASSSSSSVKLARDWKEKSGQLSQPTFSGLPPVEISKGASEPVKLPKDWRDKAGQSTSPTSENPVKLSQNWKEEMSQSGFFSNTSTTYSFPTKLAKNWKESCLEGKHLGSVGSDAMKLPKNWKEKDSKVNMDRFVAPTKLPKDWNKDALKTKSAPVKLGKDWQSSAEKKQADKGAKLSKDWNKNLELSKRAFAVKLPKGWMEQALAEQRQRRLERQSTGAAASQRRERRRNTDCTLLLPSDWEKLPPQELISNLCSSAQAKRLSSEAKEKLESELTDRLLGKDRDEQAVRLEKGWAKHLPPQPEGSRNSRLPARLVLPTDWEEKEAEKLAAELGVTLPPEQEETEVLPRNWAVDLHAGEGEKIRKHGEGSVKKKKCDETEKRRSTQLEKKSEERRPRGRPKKAKGEKKSEDRRPRGRPKKAKVEQASKPDLCEYELIRLENIRQREELFAELHLGEAKADVTLPQSAKSKAVKVSKSKKAKGSKSEKLKGSKSEKEVQAEVIKQLERPALEGWKREVVISKVSFGCPFFVHGKLYHGFKV